MSLRLLKLLLSGNAIKINRGTLFKADRKYYSTPAEHMLLILTLQAPLRYTGIPLMTRGPHLAGQKSLHRYSILS